MKFDQLAFDENRRWKFGCFLLLVLASLSSTHAWGQSPQGKTTDPGGAVLLTNDRTIEGTVEELAGFYRITVGTNSTVSIPREQVRYVARDIGGLYRLKSDAIPRWEIGDHFQMARWCMLNGLLPEAVKHYRVVQKKQPDHRSVRQLAVELESKLLEIPEFRQHLGLAPATNMTAGNADSQQATSQESVPSATGQNLTGRNSTTEIATTNIATTRGTTSPPGVSSASATTASVDLENTVMHPEVAARFTQRVQPILLNRCSQSACHGGQSDNAFRVIEPYRAAYERQTDQNLKSVLNQVSRNPSRLSALLRYATTAHGIQKQAGISVTETELLAELTQWIRMVQQPVQTAIAHSNSASQVHHAVGQGIPARSLVPVQPGLSGLKPVPRMGNHAAAIPDSATGEFPGGDVPGENEIDRLEDQLRVLLGEPPRVKPAHTPPGIPPASGSGQSIPAIPASASAPANGSAAVPDAGQAPASLQNTPIDNGPSTQDPFDPNEFNRQSRSS